VPAQTTYASYHVKITHYADRDELLKPVVFTGTTAVVGASGSAEFLSASGLPSNASCNITPSAVTPTPTPPTIVCTFLDGLNLKSSFVEFDLVVRTPILALATTGAQINFTSTTRWTEPNEWRWTSGGWIHPTEYEPGRSASTLLAAPDPLKVSSYVPAGGGTLSTGLNGGIPAPTTSNTWTATVTLPTTAPATTVGVVNFIDPVTCAPNLLDCSSSTLSIPGGPFANLVITLRRDASTIAKYAKISSAKIFYSDPLHANSLVVYPLQVPACTDTTYGTLPLSGIPCIASRKAVYQTITTTSSTTTSYRDDDDDHKKLLYWEFVINAVDNGKYTQ
jgi:hypothetical protein